MTSTRMCMVSALFAVLLFPSFSEAASMKQGLEEVFQIYLLNAEQRSRRDRIVIKGNTKTGFSADIHYWRSLQSRNPAEEICNAYSWMLFGRGTYGKGISEAFNRYGKLKKVRLHFFDIERSTKIGKKRAEILPSERYVPYLRVGIERKSLKRRKLNWKAIERKIETGKCSQLGQYFDEKWFDEAYLKQTR